MDMERTNFDNGPIEYIVVSYGSMVDLYRTGTSESRMLEDGSLIAVSCIFPVLVQEGAGYVAWFDIFDQDNFLIETINPKFVVKVGHGIAVAKESYEKLDT